MLLSRGSLFAHPSRPDSWSIARDLRSPTRPPHPCVLQGAQFFLGGCIFQPPCRTIKTLPLVSLHHHLEPCLSQLQQQTYIKAGPLSSPTSIFSPSAVHEFVCSNTLCFTPSAVLSHPRATSFLLAYQRPVDLYTYLPTLLDVLPACFCFSPCSFLPTSTPLPHTRVLLLAGGGRYIDTRPPPLDVPSAVSEATGDWLSPCPSSDGCCL